ncbi:MAG: GC-type dockerin domain-anchored protein [Planctomycetota bacterium]
MRNVIAALALGAVSTAASGQVIEISLDETEINVFNGSVDVPYSVYLDLEGADTVLVDFETGPVEYPFVAWSGFYGQFHTTAGEFLEPTEHTSDSAGGTVETRHGDVTFVETDWEGRRPGAASADGSLGQLSDGSPIFLSMNGGYAGSYRYGGFSDEFDHTPVIYDGGTRLGGQHSENLVCQALAVDLQRNPTPIPYDTRLEVFRGTIRFTAADTGLQRLTFDGRVALFIPFGGPDSREFVSFEGETIGGEATIGGFISVAAYPTTCGFADMTTSGATLPGTDMYGQPDGIIDLEDLGYFLNAWLARDGAIADVTTTGASLEGMPGYRVPDGMVDLEDLGAFLVNWITGCN